MNRVLILALILFMSRLASAKSGFLVEEDDVAPARAAQPAVTVTAPAPAASDSDEEDDQEDEKPAPVKHPYLSPARNAARGIAKPKPVVRHDDEDDETDARYTPRCTNCSRPPVQAHIHIGVRVTARADILRSPIWASFARNFAACAPGCQPVNGSMGVWRDPHARPRPSCHHSGQAIDIGAMKCSDGRTYRASAESRTGRGRFSDMVRCMSRSMKTLYMRADHYDHAHFSNGCIASGHRMY